MPSDTLLDRFSNTINSMAIEAGHEAWSRSEDDQAKRRSDNLKEASQLFQQFRDKLTSLPKPDLAKLDLPWEDTCVMRLRKVVSEIEDLVPVSPENEDAYPVVSLVWNYTVPCILIGDTIVWDEQSDGNDKLSADFCLRRYMETHADMVHLLKKLNK